MDPDLLKYVEQNRATYTTEAIMRQLLAAGHSTADIDAAMWAAGYSEVEVRATWKTMEGGMRSSPDQPYVSPVSSMDYQVPQYSGQTDVLVSPLFWATLAGYLLLTLGSAYLVPTLAPSLGAYACGLFIAVQIAAIVTYFSVGNDSPSLSRGLIVGVVLVFVFSPLIFLGICVVTSVR